MKRLGLVRTLFVSLLLVASIASFASAQLPTGTILGTVRDASGAVIPGVTIAARSTETGTTRTALSAEQGEFRLVALPVGGYQVRAELTGFQTQVRNGVTLAVGQDAVLNFVMEVGAVAETVEVTVEAPLVNTTSGTLGSLVDEKQVAELPLNGRNYTDLTLLQPGVVAHRSGNQSMSNPGTMFSSNGAPLRSNNYLLDGAMMGGAKDSSSASVGHTSLGVEGIREWQVVTNSFSAEYGMRMGAQMTLVSKGGSNEVHGSLFEYHRDSALDARNFFDYKTPTNRKRLPAFTRNQWGGSLGGPIKTDKLFYFGTFEFLKERLGLTNVLNVPGAGCHGAAGATITNAACPQLGNVASVTVNPVVAPFLAIYPNPNLPNNQFTYLSSQTIDETYGQGRVDWIMSPKDSFFVRYTADSAERLEPLGFPGFARVGESLNQFLTFGESHTFSPALLGTFRLSYSRPRANIISNQPFTGPEYAFIPGKAIGGITVSTGVNSYGPDNRTPNNNLVRLYTWSSDLYYTKGRQTLKFGVLSNIDHIFFDNANFERGSVTFADLASILAGNYTQYDGLAADARGVRNLLYQTWGFYVQDDVKALSNLTVNLGFRYEFHTNVSERNGQMSAVRDILKSTGWTVGPFFQNPSLKGFSPRVGFAWDVKGDGKTSVRGGAAIVYDVGALGGYLSFTGNRLPPFNPQQIEDIPGTLRSIPLVFRPYTITGSEAITGISFDYNLKNPHMAHYNLAIERSLVWGMGMSVAYAGSRGFNLLGSREGNPPLPSSIVNGRPVWTGTEGRLNPNLGSVDRETASFNSWYNSLQFVVRKQLSRGLQFQSAYTWGKNIDEKGGVTGAESGGSAARGSAIYQWRQSDRGRADWDVAHSWRFNGIYHFPQVGWQGLAGNLVNGWWMGGIVQAQTGLPFTPSTASPIRGTIGTPDLAPGRTKESIMKGVSSGCAGVAPGTPLGTTQRWFDPCAFIRPPQGMTGNVGRNTLDGPGVLTVDMSMSKDTGLRMLGESGALQFRTEVFNILNRANFSRPNRSVFRATGTQAVPATAAQITATDTTSRQIQFALKVLW